MKEKGEENGFLSGRGGSLSLRLRLVLIAIVLIMGVSFLVAFLMLTRNERREFEIRESENLIISLTGNVNSSYEGYKNLSRLIMMEDNITRFMKAPAPDVTLGMNYDAKHSINKILNVTSSIDSVYLIRKDLQYSTTDRGGYTLDRLEYEKGDWTESIEQARGRVVMNINGNGILSRKDGRPVVSLTRAMFDINSQKHTGYLIMCISSSVLERSIEDQKTDCSVCYVSTDGNYLAGDEKLTEYYNKEFNSERVQHSDIRLEGEKMLLSGHRISGTPVIVLCANDLSAQRFSYRSTSILIFLIVMVVVSIILAGLFLTNHVTRPINYMVLALEEREEPGKIREMHFAMPNRDMQILEDSFNRNARHVNELFDRLIENEKMLQKAEIRVLQEQIKPHFLYNSLETIGFLAMDAGAEDVHSALETLGSFYRNFLSKGDREIPLSREINIIKDYLSLQKLRYGDILEDEYEIAEDTVNCMIPKLILQPLVENSIYHGIRQKGEPGTIRIRSELRGKDLHIYVKDTGVGMSQEAIDTLLHSKSKVLAGEGEADPAESFGLWGTIERIRCFCNTEDVVRIVSEPGEYTEIEIVIWKVGFYTVGGDRAGT